LNKLLVTGATGFIGSHLVDRLIGCGGNDIRCLIRPTSNVKYLRNKPVSLFTHMNGYKPDVIYHIAGVLGAKGIPIETYREPHVEMTQKLLEMKPKRFVYLSTGWASKGETLYEQTKTEGEELVKASGVPHSIIRPGFIYGSRDMHHFPLFKVISIMGSLTPVMGSENVLTSPMYIDDLVELLTNEKEGVQYGCSQLLPMHEFIENIASVLHKGKPRFHLRYVPTEYMKSIVRWRFFTEEHTNQPVENPTSLTVGLSKTVDWYRNVGLLPLEGRKAKVK
jgi:nucleoside-diphosphate-sugar epimerase